MQIIDGKATSLAIQDEIKEEVQRRVASGGKKPHLAAIIVGDNPASRAYVGHKIKACERVGFDSTLVELSENIQEEQLLDEVEALNANSDIDGFIVQLPYRTKLTRNACSKPYTRRKTSTGFIQSMRGTSALDCLDFSRQLLQASWNYSSGMKSKRAENTPSYWDAAPSSERP